MFSGSVAHKAEALVLRNQLSKSGTRIGVNYREAKIFRNPKDFKNKIKTNVARASKIDCWLEIIETLNGSKKDNL